MKHNSVPSRPISGGGADRLGYSLQQRLNEDTRERTKVVYCNRPSASLGT